MRKKSFFSSATTTFTYYQNDQTTPTSQPTTIETSTRHDIESSSAIKIQSTYRSYLIRTLIKKISSVNSEANKLQQLLQSQETVDLIRSNEKEKLRMNEALMSLLLRLDSVPGIDPTVREVRRKVSRRIVGLQEILDAVADSRVEGLQEMMRKWEEVVVEMEEGVWEDERCRTTVEGREMERFCFEKFGFRCMERFLRGV